jgi:hypothetical protein
MEYEKQEIVKQRKAMKADISAEIKKVHDSNRAAGAEFRRVNSILERQREILSVICEDSVLMQMMQE